MKFQNCVFFRIVHAIKRLIMCKLHNFIRRGRSVSSEQENSESEQTEKSPLVSAKLETFAKMLFNRTANASQDSSGGSAPKESSSSSPTRWLKNEYAVFTVKPNKKNIENAIV